MRKVERRTSQRGLHLLEAICWKPFEDHLGAGLMSHVDLRYSQRSRKSSLLFKKGGTARISSLCCQIGSKGIFYMRAARQAGSAHELETEGGAA